MFFVSVTRLRLRSVRFLPWFAMHALGSLGQAKRSAGFQVGSVLADRGWTFWTLTVWDDHESMRRYMTAGSHRAAMPHLMHWCDEASVVHWEQTEASLPGWVEAERRMRAGGRASKVNSPSACHATLSFAAPRAIRTTHFFADPR